MIELTGSRSKHRAPAAAAGRSEAAPARHLPGARALGWEPSVPLREGLSKTIAYFEQLLADTAVRAQLTEEMAV